MQAQTPRITRNLPWHPLLLLAVAVLLVGCGGGPNDPTPDPQIDTLRQENEALARNIDELSTQVAELRITPAAAAASARTSAPTLPLIPMSTLAPTSTPSPSQTPAATSTPSLTPTAEPTAAAPAPTPAFESVVPSPTPTTRRTNPTAPNELTKYLSGDFTDSDGDGMTDAAERKYGFDPLDPSSFPAEPEPTTDASPEKHPIEGSEVGAYYEIGPGRIDIRWENPGDGKYITYALSLRPRGSAEWRDYYGSHNYGHAPIVLRQLQLTGTETLVGKFSRHVLDRTWVGDFSEFTIDLSSLEFSEPSIVGDPSNRIGYTFSGTFPQDAQEQYRRFLKRVFPILYEYLGPPAETFDILISDGGEDEDAFFSTRDGRVLLTDASFLPRLIVHELVHAWEGSYGINRDENWQYDDSLSGFAEGIAEGTAFEIIHEYVRSYPNDSAALRILDDRPYQYWSPGTTYYDAIKNLRWTGGGDFWNPPSGADSRYSISAATVQMMVVENPNFIKEFMALFYQTIREHTGWRPSRDDLLAMWVTLVPELNGYPLGEFLDTLPVFNGRELDEGAYVLQAPRSYGESGDQQFALAYAIPDGRLWWGIREEELDSVPEWIRTSRSDDGRYYIDTQGSTFAVEVTDAYGREYASHNFKTTWDRVPDGSPAGLGWFYAEDLAMENFPNGLYKGTVTFTDYIDHDPGASEGYYFFGLEGFEQDREKDYVIMVGVDGVPEGTADITLEGEVHTASIRNGAAVFRSREWPFDMTGRFPITITGPDSVSRTYYRTLVEAGTFHDYFQHQFIIVDVDFDGVEDQFE